MMFLLYDMTSVGRQNVCRQCSAFARTVRVKIDVFERCELYDRSTLIGLHKISKVNSEYEHQVDDKGSQ